MALKNAKPPQVRKAKINQIHQDVDLIRLTRFAIVFSAAVIAFNMVKHRGIEGTTR
jgi:hypothetical protein